MGSTPLVHIGGVRQRFAIGVEGSGSHSKTLPAFKALPSCYSLAMAHEELFAKIKAGSPYLKALLYNYSDFAAAVLAGNPEHELQELLIALSACGKLSTRTEVMQALRQNKQKLALLVALYDLTALWPLEKVTAALTRFADTAVQAALEFLWRQEITKGNLNMNARDTIGKAYVVLAMGKMGAFELNYSSDIDLIVFYDAERAPLTKDVEPSQFFVKFTQALVAILQDQTADGYVFRTDLRLRPDPRATQIAIDVEAAAIYYETQGQNWERAAMIKARPCAGDMELGVEFIARMRPYIWRKYLDYAAIADVQSMKRQIHVVKGHGEIAVLGHNLKLGRGGIREIEFFVQTQQLIAGGRNPALRCTRTCDGLDALANEKWITHQTAAEMKEAYRFLRMLEHRAQMIDDQQTHNTPSNPVEFESFAHFSGFETGAVLAIKLRQTLECVQSHYAALFETAEDLSAKEGSLVFTGGEDDPATLETLRRMGFGQVSEVAAIVRSWHFGRYRAMRTARAREVLTEIMPNLLKALAQTGEADTALFTFDKFLQGLPSGVQLLAMIKANPKLLGLIAQVLGSAPRLAEKISAQPRILETVLTPAFYGALPSLENLQKEIAELIPLSASLEETMELTRVFAREKNFQVGVRILSETVNADEAGLAHTNIANVVIGRLLEAAHREVKARYGDLKTGACIVLGLGKLGGHEMTATSDLDIMLIYDHATEVEITSGPHPVAPEQFYAKLTQILVTALSAPTSEGRLYEVDMRLRPSGTKGPLAVSRAAFETYQKNEAWTWERMALTRARVVAGETKLAKKINFAIHKALTAPRGAATIKTDISKMRALMLREQKNDGLWDLKRVIGGQVEIEFITQYLELLHGAAHPKILNANTHVSLKAAADAKLLDAAGATALIDALGLYQRLTHILRLSVDGPFNPNSAPKNLLRALSMAAAQPDFGATEVYLVEVQTCVARLFMKLVGRE